MEALELHRHQEIILLEVRGTPIFDKQGKISHAIIAFTDISDRKKAQKILADYNHTLETQVRERTAELIEINSKLEQEICDRLLAEIALQHAKEAAETANQAKTVWQI